MLCVRMRRFRSLLIDRANVRVAGLQVLRFSVHRHLAEHASVMAHRHAWSQAIIYLAGAGIQTIGSAKAQVEPGSLVLLAPGQPHAFVRRHHRPPMSVLIDFRLRGARRHRSTVSVLNRSEIAQVRQLLSQLMKLQAEAGPALKWEGAIPVLQVLLLALRAAGWIERTPVPAASSSPALAALLSSLLQRPSLADAIAESGYHRDHLNRLVKQQTGLTLGQYRAHLRLTRAKAMLAEGVQVAAAATAVGLPDQGYFSRWFRRQTGQSPSRWRQTQGRMAPERGEIGPPPAGPRSDARVESGGRDA
ncbi:MAG TPA: AraC family transcriptional regulator [Opitutaceae bacterium]|nr:AraC family transcriptional regulator [Opitutaceae bacterium]